MYIYVDIFAFLHAAGISSLYFVISSFAFILMVLQNYAYFIRSFYRRRFPLYIEVHFAKCNSYYLHTGNKFNLILQCRED